MKPALRITDPQEVIFTSNIEWMEHVTVLVQSGHHLKIANRPLDRTLGFFDTHDQRILLYPMKHGWYPLSGKILSVFEMNNDQLLLELGMGTLKLEKHSIQELSEIWEFGKFEGEELIQLNDAPPEMTPEELEWAEYEPRARAAIKAGLSVKDVSPEIAKVMKKIIRGVTRLPPESPLPNRFRNTKKK